MKPIETATRDHWNCRFWDEKEFRFLQNLQIFQGILSNEVANYLQKSNKITVPGGAIIFLQGDPVSDVYIVLDGLIKLARTTENGEEGVVSILMRGSIYIEATSASGGVHPASGFALTPSRILKIPARHFFNIALKDSRMVQNILGVIAEHVWDLTDRVEELSLKSSSQRLASYLASLCGNDEGAEIIRLPLSKCIIAQLLGMKPETLSRSFTRLRALGVNVYGEKVTIRDVASLCEYGCANSSSKSAICDVG